MSKRMQRSGMGTQLARPIQFRANPELTRRYRFVSSSGTSTLIQSTTLAAACGVVATSATVGQSIVQALKVREVEIWAPPSSQGSAVTCSILWQGGSTSQPREVSDTSVSTAIPAHVKSGPPAGSLASFWTTANNSLFTLVAPSGSIIDVTVSLVLADGNASTIGAAVLVGATTGRMYYCA